MGSELLRRVVVGGVRVRLLIAALFVEADGTYAGLPGVDPWPESRDARTYPGPHAVVAHPPCGRWCQLARLNEAYYGYRVGDDGGCFASALDSVRRFGGVLEHPAYTLAWAAHGLPRPRRGEGWCYDASGCWVCQVSQVAYGCPARKRTWLYYVGLAPPFALDWSEPPARAVVGKCSNRSGTPLAKRLAPEQARKTPPAFRDVLLRLAAQANPSAGPTSKSK